MSGKVSDSSVKTVTLLGAKPSHYTQKVQMACRQNGVQLDVHEIPPILSWRQKNLPAPHTFPCAKVEGTWYFDTNKILEAIDKAYNLSQPVVPSDKKDEITKLCTEMHEGYYVQHWFATLTDQGYAASNMVVKFKALAPPGLKCALCCCLWDPCFKGIAAKPTTDLLKLRGWEIPECATPDEELKVARRWLPPLEERLAATQQWLVEGDYPTAADYSLLCIVDPLVGDAGLYKWGTACPSLFEPFPALTAWFDRMKKTINYANLNLDTVEWPKYNGGKIVQTSEPE